MFKLLSFDRWKKTPDSRQIVFGRSEITTSRMAYLRVLYNYRQEDTADVYVDETYLCIPHTTPYEPTMAVKEFDRTKANV